MNWENWNGMHIPNSQSQNSLEIEALELSSYLESHLKLIFPSL